MVLQSSQTVLHKGHLTVPALTPKSQKSFFVLNLSVKLSISRIGLWDPLKTTYKEALMCRQRDHRICVSWGRELPTCSFLRSCFRRLDSLNLGAIVAEIEMNYWVAVKGQQHFQQLVLEDISRKHQARRVCGKEAYYTVLTKIFWILLQQVFCRPVCGLMHPATKGTAACSSRRPWIFQ